MNLPAESSDDISPHASLDLFSSDEEGSMVSVSSQPDALLNSCMLKIFHWVIWVVSFRQPTRISVVDNHRRTLPEHESIPPLSEITFVEVYLENGEIWKASHPSLLWTVIPSTAKRALIRLPDARKCLAFAAEHRMLHKQLGIVAPTQWKYVSLIESVPMHNCGEIFTIVAYGEGYPDAPKVFVVRLTKYGELRWRDYPRLLIHILGTVDDEIAYPPANFYAWDPTCHKWSVLNPDEEFQPEDKVDFLLVRHKSNTRAPGLSRWLDHITAQVRHPAGPRYTVPVFNPFPWNEKDAQPPPPIGNPSALSAHYIRSTFHLKPRPETVTTHLQIQGAGDDDHDDGDHGDDGHGDDGHDDDGHDDDGHDGEGHDSAVTAVGNPASTLIVRRSKSLSVAASVVHDNTTQTIAAADIKPQSSSPTVLGPGPNPQKSPLRRSPRKHKAPENSPASAGKRAKKAKLMGV
uniref:Probable 3-oxoacyl-[acyl-carrier-protein] reductase oxidoreductase (EC) n=1 Tax=Ganoderma boninense TaxID=34458 RepID=A0A5K1JYH0_9APHY|nr:Probable 3-oxoacyl-[acyl-carrier-protein] reductase oxidoreductase (EC [Ganoderma boninense]